MEKPAAPLDLLNPLLSSSLGGSPSSGWVGLPIVKMATVGGERGLRETTTKSGGGLKLSGGGAYH